MLPQSGVSRVDQLHRTHAESDPNDCAGLRTPPRLTLGRRHVFHRAKPNVRVLNRLTFACPLALPGCVGALTNATIQTHFAPLAPLQHLSLEGCWKITNEGIKVLSQTCRDIKTIKLSGCYKLSDDALKFLSDNCYGKHATLYA